jgi:multidrug efflux pump subunit AcrA (membrane-fusion protein)
VAREVLADPVDLASMAAVASSRVAQAEADAAEARTARDIAKRYVDRLTVLAPVDGIVLRLESAPGSVVGPLSMSRGGGAEAPGSSGGGEGSLVAIYDPKRLQARIDVLLSSAGGVGVGQQAELFLEALPGKTFHGEVTRVVSEADPLKNTLQAKVRVIDPDPLMRPEMVVRARFLAPKLDAVAAGGEAATTARLLVPRRALRDGAVFVVDPRRGGRSRRVAVTKVAEEGDFVEVTGDLSATHRVILDAVGDGERIVAEGGAQ